MTKKKIYNPFKMVGSYIGLIIGFLFVIWNFSYHCVEGFCEIRSPFENLSTSNWFMYPLFLLIGFLLGYGIHSLIRRLRK